MSASKGLAPRPARGLAARPRRRPGVAAFSVADEVVLLSPRGDVAHALNQSAAGVWHLCDGEHTPRDMLEALRAQYDGKNVDILADVTSALFRFHRLGLVDLSGWSPEESETAELAASPADRPRVRFVFGIEDKPYFHWQLAILFESLVCQLGAGWDITVVVCNDGAALSAELARLVEIFGVRTLTGQNHAHSHQVDFSDHRGGYVALNRVEALKVIADHVAPDDVVCLMDSDLFLYGNLREDLFPTGNAMATNVVLRDPLFLGGGSHEHGIDLQLLLRSLGCDREIKRGAVTVFMTGSTVGNDKVIKDCFRFAQIIYLLGKTAGLSDRNLWMSEMACFAMSLTANGIDYELLDTPQFAVPEPQQEMVAAGSFFHYYADVNDGAGGPFSGSAWNKQIFGARDFIAEDLESFAKGAKSDVERYFFKLSIGARRRILESRAG